MCKLMDGEELEWYKKECRKILGIVKQKGIN